jgi:glycosyltransferase involved in cell wall biosynthesis
LRQGAVLSANSQHSARAQGPEGRSGLRLAPANDQNTTFQRARVGIDGYNLALEEGTGIATYARNLSFRLGELGCQVDVLYGRPTTGRDDLAREVSFFDPVEVRPRKWMRLIHNAAGVVGAAPGVRAQRINLSGAVIAEDFRARLPHFDEIHNVSRLFQRAADYFYAFGRPLRVVMERPPDVMHWTYPLPIEVAGAKNIYTLHDLVPLRLPHTTLDRKRNYLKLVRMLARRADHLVTVSEASRRDIIEILGVAPEKVTNTYQAVEMPASVLERTPQSIADEVGGVFGLPYKGYFLFFGAIEPKKNVNRLIQAYLSANITSPLVIVGKRAWKSTQELKLLGLDDMRNEMARLASTDTPAGRRILRINYTSRGMLMSLIQGCKAVLFPSLYEGFGLPVLEAMSLGAPVITSNTSSLPEVAGDAALLVDPYDPQALTAAVRTFEENGRLREELAQRGRLRAELFSKEAYTARLGRLYRGLGLEPSWPDSGPDAGG